MQFVLQRVNLFDFRNLQSPIVLSQKKKKKEQLVPIVPSIHRSEVNGGRNKPQIRCALSPFFSVCFVLLTQVSTVSARYRVERTTRQHGRSQEGISGIAYSNLWKYSACIGMHCEFYLILVVSGVVLNTGVVRGTVACDIRWPFLFLFMHLWNWK